MTPKEKANKLANGFITKSIFDMDNAELIQARKTAKSFALLCVEEILNSVPSAPSTSGNPQKWIPEANHYWNEVKQEIDKL